MASDDMNEGERGTYIASAALFSLIQDLQERGLLIGEVRESVGASLDLFAETRTADPNRVWRSELVDIYEEIHGKPPPEKPDPD